MPDLTPQEIHAAVQTRYGRLADEFKIEVAASCCNDTAEAGCCGGNDAHAEALFSDLYSTDTGWLPVDVTGLSLGCGDPLAMAALKPGQTVLDLGSGGGIDCFLAARQVGPHGRVIGVDMTPAMIAKANRNKVKVGLENVEFRLGQIEALPVASDSVDVALSNCVINLAPDKTAVFREAFRVLKPGGRLAVSDIVTQGHFTPEERANMAAWTGCITGAEDVRAYVAAIESAGFTQISVRDKANPQVELADAGAAGAEMRVLSARVTAVKPLPTPFG